MKKRFELIIIVLLLVGTAFVLGEGLEEFNTARPLIKVDFHEEVDVINYSIKSISHEPLNVLLKNLSSLNNHRTFNFTTSWLPNAEYRFSICAKDSDENVNCGSKDFRINHPGLNITLIEPIPAIGQRPIYNITVSTVFNANCRLTYSDNPDNITRLFNEAIQTFDISGEKIHKIRFDASNFEDPIIRLIICRLNESNVDLTDESNYDFQPIWVGYYNTNPTIISITTDPNPVTDIANRWSNLSIVTNQNTVCEIARPDTPASINPAKLFNGNDKNQFHTYKKNNDVIVDYASAGLNTGQLYNLSYDIKCSNGAGLYSLFENYRIIVNLNSTLSITQLIPTTVNTESITYRIKTSISSSFCNLTVNNQTYGNMDSTNSLNFSKNNVQLKKGMNNITVFCKAVAQFTRESKFSMFMDDDIPTLAIKSDSVSCGLSKVSFEYNTTDLTSNIANLTYFLSNSSGSILLTGTSNNVQKNKFEKITIDKNLIEGQTYTITAFVYDTAGLKSENKTITVVASKSDHNDCIKCGNGKLEGDEECDGQDFGNTRCIDLTYSGNNHYVGGILSCNNECKRIVDNCNIGSGYCGDKRINNYFEEQCDGTKSQGDWGNIQNCQDFGFSGGTLTCNPPFTTNQCMFNTSGCTQSVPGAPVCGNSKIDKGEQCDGEIIKEGLKCTSFDSFINGTLSCNTDCSINLQECIPPPYCGDEIIGAGEQCEASIKDRISCSELDSRFVSGNATCNGCIWNTNTCVARPVCGNNLLEENEMCDSTKVKGLTCEDFGYEGGILGCNSDCAGFDLSNCGALADGYCGDGRINNYYNEQCDDASGSLGKKKSTWGSIRTCQDFGFKSGELSCNSATSPYDVRCKFNTSKCVPLETPEVPVNLRKCEPTNNASLLNRGEQCEISRGLKLQECTWFNGFVGGSTTCNSCYYDLSNCQTPQLPTCSNNITEEGEVCDGTDIGLFQCSDILGYNGGVLECGKNCQFNVSKCNRVEGCNNGILEGGEQCDKTELGAITCDMFGFDGGWMNCSNSCKWDTKKCGSGIQGVCGNNILESGEECDGLINNPGFWRDKLSCENLVCTSCTIMCGPEDVTCKNNIKDNAETDIDCGGNACGSCELNKTCIGDEDCTSGYCSEDKKCALPLCKNNFKDIEESDIDCGGLCDKCSFGKVCLANSDCKSNNCLEGVCQKGPCENGIKDEGESDIDCGGSCSLCDIGKTCSTSDDCQSGNCKDNICSEEVEDKKISLLLIIGLILFALSLGYIIYNIFFSNKKFKNKISNINNSSTLENISSKPINTLNIQNNNLNSEKSRLMKQKFEERKKEKTGQRISIIDTFEKEDNSKELQQKNVANTNNKETILETKVTDLQEESQEKEFLDIEELNKKNNKKIQKEEKTNKNTKNNNDKNSVFSKLSNIEKSKEDENIVEEEKYEEIEKLSPKVTKKDSKELFNKLKNISTNNKEENKDLKELLKNNELSSKQIITALSDVKGEIITSDIFKDILKLLLNTNKLSKQDIMNLLFEQLDKGNISKSDVAKISEELKIV